MYHMMRRGPTFIISVLLIVWHCQAWADAVIVNLKPIFLIVTQGESNVSIYGTITNITGDNVFLNGDNITIPAASNIIDDFLNTPPELITGQDSGLIQLFSFDVMPDAPLGMAIGSYDLYGGVGNANAGNFDPLGSQSFEINVVSSSVPEPPSYVLFMTAIAIIASLHWHRHTKAKPRGIGM